MKDKVYAVAHFFLAWLARLIFLVRSEGKNNEPKLDEGSYLVISNHISAIDGIAICAVTRRQEVRFMAKAELFKNPVLAFILRCCGAYPIERTGANAGVIKQTISMLKEGKSVGMFPQGTRVRGSDPRIGRLQSGAGLILSHSKVQVLPVYIKSKGNRVRAFHPIKVIIGKPMTYDEYTRGGELQGDARAITKCVFDRVCELGGYPPLEETKNTDGDTGEES